MGPWLFIGLGNPGPQYVFNRHNVGFMAADAIAKAHGFSAPRSKFKGELCEGEIAGEKVFILKPQTYMNLSGESAQPCAAFYKIPPARVVVFYDELDLEPGKIRGKKAGGSGGHNGIKSLDAHLGQDYWRVRIGIGHPGDKNKVTGHVLGNFTAADDLWLTPVLEALAANAKHLIASGMDTYMSKVAQHLQPPREKKEKEEKKNGL